MTMNKLDNSGLNPSRLADPYNATKPSPQGLSTVSAQPKGPMPPPSTGDHAEISDKGREMVDLKQAVDVGRAALEREPEIRADRVAQVKERLASGFYQSAEVRDRVAGRISSLVLEGGLF